MFYFGELRVESGRQTRVFDGPVLIAAEEARSSAGRENA